MALRLKFFFSGLVLLMSIGLSGSMFLVFGLWQGAASRNWPVEGDKAGQTTIRTSIPRNYFGQSLAVGDVNGDGFDDLIGGALLIGSGSLSIYVMPGPIVLGETFTMPNRAALTFQGALESGIGAYLDSGDMNGDGIDDIALGLWVQDRASVYLGSPAITADSPGIVEAVPEQMALTLSPASDMVAFCDINGDGYQDLFSELTLPGQGLQVLGVLGSASLTMTQPVTRTLPEDADIVVDMPLPTASSSPHFKNTACADIDGDSIQDLAIGVSGASPQNRNMAGTVYVIRGDLGITAHESVTLTMPTDAGAVIDGDDGRLDAMGDQLGSALAAADVDQDGRADLVLGALGAAGPANSMNYAGEVYLWLGQPLAGQRFRISSQAAWTVHGEAAYDQLGGAITTGDFDGDSLPEILLGCANCARHEPPIYLAGRGYLLEPLQITGVVTVGAAAQLEIVPYLGALHLGYAVDAMDANGDGVQEIVIGAPYETYYPAGAMPGTAYLLSYPDEFKQYLPVIGSWPSG